MKVVPLHIHFPKADGWKTRAVADDEWTRFAGADWADRVMEMELDDRFHAKQGRSIVKWTLHRGGESLCVYLKRHYQLPRWRGWLARLLPARNFSPAMQEHANLRWAEANGLPVPRSMAAVEFLGPGGGLQAAIVIKELEGMIGLHEAIPLAKDRMPAAAFSEWKRRLFAELVRLGALMHGRGAYHRDWYLCHFYIEEADCADPAAGFEGRVFVIDFHRLVHSRLLGLWWKMKDLAQLEYSAIWPGVEPADRAAYREGAMRTAGPLSRPFLRLGTRWKICVYLRNHRRKAACGRA